jgi:hypothetical protein
MVVYSVFCCTGLAICVRNDMLKEKSLKKRFSC